MQKAGDESPRRAPEERAHRGVKRVKTWRCGQKVEGEIARVGGERRWDDERGLFVYEQQVLLVERNF